MRAVNLLPPDNRGASKASAELGAGPEAKGGAGAFVVLGVLAACVAGTAGVVLADNTIKQRSADLEAEVARYKKLLVEAGGGNWEQLHEWAKKERELSEELEKVLKAWVSLSDEVARANQASSTAPR